MMTGYVQSKAKGELVKLASIKLIICDDDDLFRELLADFLKRDQELEIVGMANSPISLNECLNTTEADVLLLDINLTNSNYDGIEIAWDLHRKNTSMKIIALSSLNQEEVVTHALTFGHVTNYVVKEHFRDLPQAIRDAVAGKANLHYSSSTKLVNHLMKSQVEQIQQRFSELQLDILKCLEKGLTRGEIAEKLFHTEANIHKEICKISKCLKGTFPYLEHWHLKRVDTEELIELAKRVGVIV